ncbi:MAG: Ribonucleoside-triphosphate reductase, anaerobic-like protein [Candidatus Moranbacteria bacterium GW2011_GWE2_35_2-]|nr:MAG: Ribonucleoside-triphosphate reductase, anaerobic-like protein [Candidatus Moranbacteria bacterium GW2011_GWE2_35_2-]KKQ06043.1 MAG: Ribonucleoside-triphosphate reductase, anaerobic-like protein [Candidatus Moranbacteria bacterium GW2011_GWF1_36_4]KKQ22980.1 MAG: Ribonucleoside-triphosphate reductase, anaerobic-like protein [Candidatus Moranbacteria bacterium GW2011_GWF2_37_11]KKQ29338.1 MAG: Ribonucleoside-triphosphate reductase, anaerobic-like protein [Candidatus Moranbacteria bacterium
MVLGGFEKFTMVDYPGKLATTVFTVGCSFRCPFCHNPEFVEHGTWNMEHGIIEKSFFEFLENRKGKLEAVCITGGEPTIQPDLISFIEKIKKMGFLVKLDSNGTRPDVLKKIIDRKIVDYIAMDIKNIPEKYSETAGVKVDIERIKLSVKLIINSRIDYEFRTTVVPGFHNEKDFEKISEWIDGARAYFLQEFRDFKVLDLQIEEKTQGKKVDLEKIKNKIGGKFGKIGIRR